MNTTVSDAYFQTALVERRAQLLRARRGRPDAALADLLSQVDAALARLEQGSYGICERCHGRIETDRLVRDPLAEYCEEHPAASEADRLRRDLALAREIQLGLLPKPGLTIDGWRYAYRYEAAGDVGGDFCDVIARPSRGETLVLVGDVSGKGVGASMLMSHLLATFRSLAPLALPTGELLTRVNDLFHDSAVSSTYATLAAASLRPDGSIDLYSAGHWTPLLRRGGRTDRTPVVPGLPLGLFAASGYTPTRLQLSPDDTLLFFTDGAIDAENGNGEDYSINGLARALAAADPGDINGVVDRCLRDLRQFQNGHRPDDDLLLFGLSAGRATHPAAGRSA